MRSAQAASGRGRTAKEGTDRRACLLGTRWHEAQYLDIVGALNDGSAVLCATMMGFAIVLDPLPIRCVGLSDSALTAFLARCVVCGASPAL